MIIKLVSSIGQKVAIKIIEHSNASRGIKMTLDNIEDWCFEGKVEAISKKYITVTFNGRYGTTTEKFNIEDEYKQKYTTGGASYKLYLNKEEIIKEYKTNELYSNIKNCFVNNKKLTLNQLERINSIINESIGVVINSK